MRYLFVISIFSVVFAYEKDMTIMVQAGKVDCFFHKVNLNEIIDVEYQVIDSTHGDLDVSFQLTDPTGRVLVADYKKPENTHRHTALLEGDYRFCFDNSFSTFSQKTVFFDILIDNEAPEEKDYDDDKEMEFGNAAETYMMRVKDISDTVSRVKDHVSTVRRLQELHSAHEARDRNLAEDMCGRVMNWSITQIFLMIFVGITQIARREFGFDLRVEGITAHGYCHAPIRAHWSANQSTAAHWSANQSTACAYTPVPHPANCPLIPNF